MLRADRGVITHRSTQAANRYATLLKWHCGMLGEYVLFHRTANRKAPSIASGKHYLSPRNPLLDSWIHSMEESKA